MFQLTPDPAFFSDTQRVTHKRTKSGSYANFFPFSNDNFTHHEYKTSDFNIQTSSPSINSKNRIKRQRLNITPPSEKLVMTTSLLTPASLACSPTPLISFNTPLSSPQLGPSAHLQDDPKPQQPESSQLPCGNHNENSGGFLYGYDYYGEFTDQFTENDDDNDMMRLTDDEMDLSDNEYTQCTPPIATGHKNNNNHLIISLSPSSSSYSIPDNYSDDFNHDLIDNSVEVEDYIHSVYCNRR